jgi:hypothetical protein
MKNRIGLVLSMLVGILLAGYSVAFGSPDYTIRLVSGIIQPAEDTGEFTQLSGDLQQRESVHCLVQLFEVPDSRTRSALEQAGITLLDFIPHYAWLASLNRLITPSQAKSLGIRWAGSLDPAAKQHPRIQRGDYGEWSDYEDGKVIITVRLYADVAAITGETLARTYGAVTGDFIQTLNTWVMAIDPELIEAVAAEDAVEWIDVLPPPLTAINDVAREVVGANTVQGPPYRLDGSGTTVCVYDAGMIDNTHDDFAGRIALGEGGSTASHATHVAGSVGGDGANSGGQYRGMAPGCNLVSFKYEECDPYCLYNSPQDIEGNYGTAITMYGADLATNSIGSNIASNGYNCDWEGDYELVSELVDNIVRGSLGTPFIVVFAAGNERGNGRCGTTYSTMGVPAGAKNIITVGATDDYDDITYFSSWGPTDDGRTKPEVCAPGLNIYSTLPGNTYGNMSGTSMSTPITSGCIALVLEQLSSSYPGLTVLPSTVKAILINTAVDLGNTGPDYVYGYGRVDVQAAVDAVMNGHFLEDQVAVHETDHHAFNVPGGTSSLRVSLAWMDPAAAPMSDPTLVNDLDITLTSPSSTVYHPYILNPSSPSNPATTGADHINNSEQIVVEDPEEGQWTINICSTDLPDGPQSYSVAASLPILTGYGTVNGTVTDASTSLPIGGVLVENLSGLQSTTTNPSGEYELFLPASTLTLQYSAFGYVTDTEVVTVPDGGTVTQDKALTPAPTGALYGYVYDPDDAPICGAEVEALDVPIEPVFTNELGYYTLNLPIGHEYTVRARAAGYGDDQYTIDFDGSMQQDFHLTAQVCYDFESPQGWTAGAPGDDATTGIWERTDPQGTYYGGNPVQPEDDHTEPPGVNCWVTGGSAGSGAGSYDVDDGRTTLLSPVWDLTNYESVILELWTWYSNDEGAAPGTDYFVVDVSCDGGSNWVNLINTNDNWEYWRNDRFNLETYVALTNQVQLRVVASDEGEGSLVEAAVDDVCLYGSTPQVPDAPTELVVLLEGCDIHLFWQPSDGATGYRIERALELDGTYELVENVGAEILDWVHTGGASTDGIAFYRVIATR